MAGFTEGHSSHHSASARASGRPLDLGWRGPGQHAPANRRRRTWRPLVTVAVILAAMAAGAFTGLSFVVGSFSDGGAIIDQKISQWRADVLTAASRAADQGAREADRNAQTADHAARDARKAKLLKAGRHKQISQTGE